MPRLKANPDDPTALDSLGAVPGNTNSVLGTFTRLTDGCGAVFRSRSLLPYGVALAAAQRLTEAETSFERSLSIQPGLMEAQLALSEL